MTEWFHLVAQWTGVHPVVACCLVGIVSFLESLTVVGLIVPGVVILFAAGALVADGALGLWPTLGATAVGAIAGDGLGYCIGRRYRTRIRQWRLVRRHVAQWTRAEQFVHRHGGKSVLLGRFVGPLRPIVPAVAGMLGMPAGRFYPIDVAAALLWAPLYLLPGMVVGLSLLLAREIAGRLSLLMGILVFAGYAIVRVIRWFYLRIRPHVLLACTRIGSWMDTHPRLTLARRMLLAPGPLEHRATAIWLFLLLAGAWLFLDVMKDVVTHAPLVAAGESVFQLLQHWRSPMGDCAMVILSGFGDAAVVFPVAVLVLAALLRRRAWWDACCWTAAGGFAALAVAVIKLAVRIPRPIHLSSGVDAYSFPSGHATMSMVMYGFLAVLVSPTLSAHWRWLPYAVSALLVGGIAFSRLYLGAHWLADVAGGLGLGLVWVALLAITRHRYRQSARPLHGFAPVIIAVFLGSATLHLATHMDADMLRYAVRDTVVTMPEEAWWTGDWRRIPSHRIDMEGEQEQPLNLQWAGSLPEARQYLQDRGWTSPLPLSLRSALRWLLREPRLQDLPILPQLHNGRHESLCLVLRDRTRVPDSEQIVLRLWPTPVVLGPSQCPLWVGNVTVQHIRHLPLVRFPATEQDVERPLSVFAAMAADAPSRLVHSAATDHRRSPAWSGRILLRRASDTPAGKTPPAAAQP